CSCTLGAALTACRGWCCASRRTLGAGPGVAVPKRRLLGCEAGHAGLFSRPRLPSRAHLRGGVGDESFVERVADAPLQRAQRVLLRFAFGEFAVVIGAA